jgi:hypothetical protein
MSEPTPEEFAAALLRGEPAEETDAPEPVETDLTEPEQEEQEPDDQQWLARLFAHKRQADERTLRALGLLGDKEQEG